MQKIPSTCQQQRRFGAHKQWQVTKLEWQKAPSDSNSSEPPSPAVDSSKSLTASLLAVGRPVSVFPASAASLNPALQFDVIDVESGGSGARWNHHHHHQARRSSVASTVRQFWARGSVSSGSSHASDLSSAASVVTNVVDW
jgi:hypothetical protein